MGRRRTNRDPARQKYRMKGNSQPTNDVSLNPSTNPSIHDVIDAVGTSRRQFVKGGVGAAALATAGGLTLGGLVSAVQAAPVAARRSPAPPARRRPTS